MFSLYFLLPPGSAGNGKIIRLRLPCRCHPIPQQQSLNELRIGLIINELDKICLKPTAVGSRHGLFQPILRGRESNRPIGYLKAISLPSHIGLQISGLSSPLPGAGRPCRALALLAAAARHRQQICPLAPADSFPARPYNTARYQAT